MDFRGKAYRRNLRLIVLKGTDFSVSVTWDIWKDKFVTVGLA